MGREGRKNISSLSCVTSPLKIGSGSVSENGLRGHKLATFSEIFPLPTSSTLTPMSTPLQTIGNILPAARYNVAEWEEEKTARGGRNYVKKCMEDKNSNKGWADGLREDVLGKYIPRFKAAWFGVSRETEVEEVSASATLRTGKTEGVPGHARLHARISLPIPARHGRVVGNAKRASQLEALRRKG